MVSVEANMRHTLFFLKEKEPKMQTQMVQTVKNPIKVVGLSHGPVSFQNSADFGQHSWRKASPTSQI